MRCGYCDFNTYTAAELGPAGGPPGASRESYAEAAVAEVRLARRVLGDVDRPVDTVFFGGGTPTLLPPDHLVRVLDAIRRGVRSRAGSGGDDRVQPRQRHPGRPRTAPCRRVQPDLFRDAVVGAPACSRCSTGPTTPKGCPAQSVGARAAGFDQVSLDLIYGTPGESLEDWRTSPRACPRLRAGPRLGVRPHRRAGHRPGPAGEPGTAAGARRRRPGRQVPPRRRPAEQRPATPGTSCRTGHVTRPRSAGTTCSTGAAATGGASVRERTPTSAGCAGGTSGTRLPTPPGSRRARARPRAREVLDDQTPPRGADPARDPAGRGTAGRRPRRRRRRHGCPELRERGLVTDDPGRVLLTLQGRLLADAVVRDLVA